MKESERRKLLEYKGLISSSKLGEGREEGRGEREREEGFLRDVLAMGGPFPFPFCFLL